MKKNKLQPLSPEIQQDLKAVNANLFLILESGIISPAVKTLLIESLKKLPVNNSTELAKYC